MRHQGDVNRGPEPGQLLKASILGAVCIPIYNLKPHSGVGKEDFTAAYGAVGRLLRATAHAASLSHSVPGHAWQAVQLWHNLRNPLPWPLDLKHLSLELLLLQDSHRLLSFLF